MPDKSTGYRRTRAAYPIAGELCERCRKRPARLRHHVDGDVFNLSPANVQRLCYSCHSSVHQERDVCVHGHPMVDGNVYLNGKGHRKCRACNRARYHARKLTSVATI